MPISACSKVLSTVSWPLLSTSRGMRRTHNVLESQPSSEQRYCLQALSSSQLHLGTLVFYKEMSIPTGKKKHFPLFSTTAASLSFHANVLALWLSGWCLHTIKQPLTRGCVSQVILGSVPRLPFPSLLAHYRAHVMMLGCPARRRRRTTSLSIQGIFLICQSSF